MKEIRLAILVFIFGVNAAEAAQYTELAGGVKNGGAVSGRVLFKGSTPPPKMLKIDEDVQISQHYEGVSSRPRPALCGAFLSRTGTATSRIRRRPAVLPG